MLLPLRMTVRGHFFWELSRSSYFTATCFRKLFWSAVLKLRDFFMFSPLSSLLCLSGRELWPTVGQTAVLTVAEHREELNRRCVFFPARIPQKPAFLHSDWLAVHIQEEVCSSRAL